MDTESFSFWNWVEKKLSRGIVVRTVCPERLFPAVAMIGLNRLRRHLPAPDGSLLGTTGKEGDRRDLCHSSDESCRPALLCNAEPYQPDRSMETIHTINNLVLPITDYTQSRQCFRFGSVKLKHMCCSMYVICVYVLLSIDEHRSCPPAQFLSWVLNFENVFCSVECSKMAQILAKQKIAHLRKFWPIKLVSLTMIIICPSLLTYLYV